MKIKVIMVLALLTLSTVIMSATNYQMDTSSVFSIIALPQPQITAGGTSVCAGSSYTYQSNADASVSYKWVVTGGTINGASNQQSVTINWFSNPGAGTLRLVHTKTSSGCSDSTTENITINPLPDSIVSGNKSVCKNDSETYSVNNVVGNTYKWYVTGGTLVGMDNSSQIDVLWDQQGMGSIKIVIIVNATGCSDSSTFGIVINPKPTPKINGAIAVLKNSTETYTTTTSANEQSTWYPTDGTINGPKTGNTVSIVWDSVGIGKLKLVQINSVTGCKDSTEIDVDISDKAPVIINGQASVCENNEESYSTSSNADLSNLWSVIGGTISGAKNQSTVKILWGKKGTGKVKLTQTTISKGTTDSTELNITINPLPVPVINGAATLYVNSQINYSSPDNNVTFKWFAENGQIQGSNTGNSVNVTWSNQGTGKVKLIETTNSTGCIDSTTLDITINAAPGLNFTGNTTVCETKEESYTSVRTANEKNNWYVTGGTIKSDDTSDVMTVVWGAPGTGTVKLVRQNPSISYQDSVEKTVIINPMPIVTFPKPGNYCEDAAKIQLTGGDPPGGKYYINGKEETELDPQKLKAGKHNVSYAFTNQKGCTDSVNYEITIFPLPAQPSITEQGDSLLSSSPTGNQWYYQDTLIPGATNQLYVAPKEGIYTSIVTDSNGCSSLASGQFYYPSGGSEPVIVLSASELISQALICESSGYDSVNISNMGGGKLTVTNAEFTGANADEFELLNTIPINVDAGKKDILIIHFKPKTAGQKTAELDLTNNSKNTVIQKLNISAKKDSIGFTLNTNTIDFIDIPAGLPTTKNFTLINTGTIALQWSCPIAIDSIFTIESINPPKVEPASQSVMKVSFAGGPDKSKFTTKYNFTESTCGNGYELDFLATVGYAPSNGSVYLRAGSLTAKPGEIVGIPFYLDSSLNLSETKVNSFKADFCFNSTILTPVYDTPKGTSEGYLRTIPIILPAVADSKGILKTIYLQANLGNDTTTSLSLKNVTPVGDSVNIKLTDGLFRLSGVCMEGGAPRLLNISGATQLMVIKPNPTDNHLEIEYETIEEGKISLYITDNFGKTVRVIQEKSEATGVKSLSYYIGDLASGIYYVNLLTPTSFKIKKFEIYK